ncbi:type IV pilus assembly protein PilM [Clostridium cavendishii DSM 21758]|uniref:Type IV pilus assembly protein PilM n=1 Tax=Clostridium cavendishii DSM 21758 TaxID=1121302 RepID=A0A1M6LJK4_9CLOT|nr:type IV pilus assembly protein PilM [Clostridium cavendishii]SHJ71381.1 type IV pilus assembly protein PilM [Clostridium cavendishii DSM 21758]
MEEKVEKKGLTFKEAVTEEKKIKKASKPKRSVQKSIKLVSIDIGSKFTKIVVGEKRKDILYINKVMRIKTAENSLTDGTLVNGVLLGKNIRAVLNNQGIKVKDVAFTNNSTSIINREVTVPKVYGDELDTLVRYEIQQFLPINLNDYILQYSEIEEVQETEAVRNRLIVVAYPKRIARSYFDMAANIGLKPNALDLHNNSIKKLYDNCNAVNGSLKSVQGTTLFIDMGAESFDVSIMLNGKLEFMRIMKTGGNIIDNKIADKFEINLEEAENKKKSEVDLGSFDLNNELNEVVKETVNEWIEELRRIIQFYANKNIGNKVSKVYLYGGTSNLNGLEQYMEKKLGIAVSKISSIDNIDIDKKIKVDNIEDYLNAFGALIRL